MPPKKLLILGGTGEAAELARLIPEKLGSKIDVVSSYSGVTGYQPELPGSVRVGGFGGAQGLISYIQEEGVSWLIDATHPFAEKMSQVGYIAQQATQIPRLTLLRPEWEPQAADRWLEVADMAEAAKQVEVLGAKTFLTIGMKEIAAFTDIENVHFVVRMMKEPKESLPLSSYEVVIGHPPFSREEEEALLQEKNIRLVVTKNSGGLKTKEKLDAARGLGLSVLMVQRPAPEPGEQLATLNEAINWLLSHGA